jgi:hypothetical protein
MEEDGFTATKLFNRGYSYTYDDVIFLPHYIDFSTNDISLSTRWVPLFSLILSSPMDIVIEGAMAAAMASLGGLDIVHSNLSTVDQVSAVLSVKSHRIPILFAPTFCAFSDRIHLLDDFDSCPYVLIIQSGSASSQLLGYFSRSDWLQGVEEFVVVWIKNNEQHKVQKLEGKIVFLCLTKKLKIKPLSKRTTSQNANNIHTNAFTKRILVFSALWFYVEVQ